MGTHKSKWWASMVNKYGSEEAVHEHMSDSSKRRKSFGGGLAALKKTDPEKLRIIASMGGKASAKARTNRERDERD